MTFDPKAAGNKGVPVPRKGYEQRLVSYRNYAELQAKGWAVRTEGGEIHKGGAILCERFVGGVPNAIPVNESPVESIDVDKPIVLSPEFIKSFGEFIDACSVTIKEPTEERVVESVIEDSYKSEQDIVETHGVLTTVSPVDSVLLAIGEAANKVIIENDIPIKTKKIRGKK